MQYGGTVHILFFCSIVPFPIDYSVTNQDYVFHLSSAFIEEAFRGRPDLSWFRRLDLGLFLFALPFCDYSVALFWWSTLGRCLNVSVSSHFNILPVLFFLLFVCRLWFPVLSFFFLVCVPENLFFSHIESALLGSCGLGMEVPILPKILWLTMVFNNQALKWKGSCYIRQMHFKLFSQHNCVCSTAVVRQSDSDCGLNRGTA
jgi:hypothetical protein